MLRKKLLQIPLFSINYDLKSISESCTFGADDEGALKGVGENISELDGWSTASFPMISLCDLKGLVFYIRCWSNDFMRLTSGFFDIEYCKAHTMARKPVVIIVLIIFPVFIDKIEDGSVYFTIPRSQSGD